MRILAFYTRLAITGGLGFLLMLVGLGQFLRFHNESAVAALAVIIGSYVAMWFFTGWIGRLARQY